jgi:hypothetical protein
LEFNRFFCFIFRFFLSIQYTAQGCNHRWPFLSQTVFSSCKQCFCVSPLKYLPVVLADSTFAHDLNSVKMLAVTFIFSCFTLNFRQINAILASLDLFDFTLFKIDIQSWMSDINMNLMAKFWWLQKQGNNLNFRAKSEQVKNTNLV